MADQSLKNISRSISAFDFFSYLLEGAARSRISDSDSDKLLTEERIQAYISAFLDSNDISLTEDCNNFDSERLEALTNESFDELFKKCFGDGTSEGFRTSFLEEAKNLIEALNEFDKGKKIESKSDKLEISILLRMFIETYRRVVMAIGNAETAKSYLSRIKMVNALNFPSNADDFNALSTQHRVLTTIEKSIERLKIPEYSSGNDIQKYCVQFPFLNNVSEDINKIADLALPYPETEIKVKELSNQYRTFDTVGVFTNIAFIKDLTNAICPNDRFKEGIKNILVDWQNEGNSKKKAYDEFLAKKLDDIRAKKLNHNEHVIGIIGHIIIMIEDNKKIDEIISVISKIFIRVYKNIANDYYIETDKKIKQLNEISENKKDFCSEEKIKKLKQQFIDLADSNLDLDKLFFENHFQINPINYLFLIYIGYKRNEINFLQKILKSHYENFILRNYTRDLIYKKMEDNKNVVNPDKADKTKSVFREYFLVLTNDKEKLTYKKDVLKYLINAITQNQPPPYETFFSDMTDIFLSVIHKILDISIFKKKSGDKQLTSIENDNYELSTYFIDENMFSIMLDRLEESGPLKEPIKRKIELRFKNEYKNIEEKYHKYLHGN
ncbi:MAG: hypothetical protein OEV44_11705 [Spirochaetota bacterium]|nr:hypothetical protein [Spirochaetota bacterium]